MCKSVSTYRSLAVLGLLILWVSACSERRQPENDHQESPASGEMQAIRSVLAIDDSLGALRNHAPETMSLSAAVQEYTDALDNVDFRGCPEAFTNAFRLHIEAWKRSKPFLEKFSHLRGEMHVLFDEIKASADSNRVQLVALEDDIWGTWAEVEATAKVHKALP